MKQTDNNAVILLWSMLIPPVCMLIALGFIIAQLWHLIHLEWYEIPGWVRPFGITSSVLSLGILGMWIIMQNRWPFNKLDE